MCDTGGDAEGDTPDGGVVADGAVDDDADDANCCDGVVGWRGGAGVGCGMRMCELKQASVGWKTSGGGGG